MIVGTAGHIDHGKTTLVAALTGVNTDKLPEEKKRGISLELGFAFMDATQGGRIGFVDVPGHERLVNTMVAGATGIDFAMLLVAADDGIMPQTHEHLAVLSLLGIATGAVVITKADRSTETEIEQLQLEIAGLLQNSSLEKAPVFVVSAHTGQGVQGLKQHIIDTANTLIAAKVLNSADGFRLAIDRVFSIDGSGTTVTGTIHAGHIVAGQEVSTVPGHSSLRVRSIHAQNQAVDQAIKGQRCALVLAGADRSALSRGQWLVTPALAHTSQRADIYMQLWHAETKPLRTGTKVHIHAGSTSVFGTVAVLDGDTLQPGQKAVAQLVLQQGIGLWWGDRIILRDASGARTIAGGRVLDSDAPARYRRSPDRLSALEALQIQSAEQRLHALVNTQPRGVNFNHFLCTNGILQLPVPSDLSRHQSGQSVWLLGKQQEQDIHNATLQALNDFHERYPDHLGLDSSRLRRLSVPRLDSNLWHSVLQQLISAGRVTVRGSFIHAPDHGATLSKADERIAALVAPHIEAAQYAGAWVRDLAKLCNEPEDQMRASLARLAQQGSLHQIVKDLYYTSGMVISLAAIARKVAEQNSGSITAAQFRDHIGTGRKRAIQVLEYFDRIGLMRRVGNSHKIRPESTLFMH